MFPFDSPSISAHRLKCIWGYLIRIPFFLFPLFSLKKEDAFNLKQFLWKICSYKQDMKVDEGYYL